MFAVPPHTEDDPRQLFDKLNNGPNFRNITNAKHDGNLPHSWRLSFGRIAQQPLNGNAPWFSSLAVTAFTDFELASARLLGSSERVRNQILSGVATTDDIQQIYATWATPFSVRRLDIVVTQHGPAVCENDEMPGGLVHAYWLDRVYGINQRRWEQALGWLTAQGPLVFAVSTDWSAPYLQEITWLVRHLSQRGMDVHMVTSSEAHRLKLDRRGVTLDGQKIATVWRLFPVFEAHGAFSVLVKAASKGKLRLVPELASWGNKAWMGVFWEQQNYFRQAMNPRACDLLANIVPYTRLVTQNAGYPSAIRNQAGLTLIEDFDDLKAIPNRQRRRLVVKTTGAHDRAARSHGVLIGTSAGGTTWAKALDQMAGLGAPLAIQEYRPPKRVDIPVWSVLNGRPELENPFNGKLLIRPWVIGGHLVSATAFLAVPDTSKLHGTTTGAEIPLDFG